MTGASRARPGDRPMDAGPVLHPDTCQPVEWDTWMKVVSRIIDLIRWLFRAHSAVAGEERGGVLPRPC
jgi:hypothetical protein